MVRLEAAELSQFMAPSVTLSFVPGTPKPKEIPKVPFFQVGRVQQLSICLLTSAYCRLHNCPNVGLRLGTIMFHIDVWGVLGFLSQQLQKKTRRKQKKKNPKTTKTPALQRYDIIKGNGVT